MQADTIKIAGGRLIDPANAVDEVVDIYLAKGKVQAIGYEPAGFNPDRTLDATGLIVIPGLVDLCARLREPGHEHKATIKSETAAAAKGGITTICCPPDTNPVIDTPAVAELIARTAMQIGCARVLPIGALTQNLEGKQLSEMAALTQGGCVALSNGEKPLFSSLVERRALEYATTFGITTILQPMDKDLRDNGCVHEGPVSSRLGLPGIPEVAESTAVAQELALADAIGCRIHLHNLSTGAAVKMIGRAQHNRVAVSADVAIHQLHLTEMDIESFNSHCHVIPPLRSLRDRDALRAGIANGVIGAICSDHQPHEAEAKQAPFPSTAPGISGLETLLPLTLKLVDEELLDLSAAIDRVTAGPADIMSLPYGRLGTGSNADICIFDPDKHWVLKASNLTSAGKNTPFLGWELKGRVTHTLLGGRLVYGQI